MKQIIISLVTGVATVAVAAGCGLPASIPPQHPLTLVMPYKDCSKEPPPPPLCVNYHVCYDLGINVIQVEVEPASPAVSKILCQAAPIAPTLTYQVYYEPGQGSYMINASYIENETPVSISAGPFGEDQNLSPWTLSIQ